MTQPAAKKARDAAAEILRLRDARQLIGPFPPAIAPVDEAEGYAVQEALHAAEVARGDGPFGGFKIGCTTPQMQERVGVDHPCFGGMRARHIVRSPQAYKAANFHRIAIECEIAVRLATGTEPGKAPYDRASIARHVATVMPAIEIVDNRYVDSKTIGAPMLVADDFYHCGAVLGPEHADWKNIDLVRARGTTAINGQVLGEGTGADVLGHPFEALAWLANALAARGRSLPAGAVVLTGSLVVGQYPVAGDKVVCAISGLGEVHVDVV